MDDKIKIFEDKKIRTAWDEETEEWIHQRILSIRVRNELTAQWKQHGVEEGKEYAILTE